MSAEIINVFMFFLITVAPFSELRGGIPFGLFQGLDPWFVFSSSIALNSLVFFPVYFGLELLYERFFERFRLARSIIKRIHERGKKVINKYGPVGLALFVGVPLPVTGVWTGAAIAWLFDVEWKRAFVSITLGVFIAALLVTGASLGMFYFLLFAF